MSTIEVMLPSLTPEAIVVGVVGAGAAGSAADAEGARELEGVFGGSRREIGKRTAAASVRAGSGCLGKLRSLPL